VLEPRSALTEQLARGGRDGAHGRRDLKISEVRGWDLAQLTAFGGREAGFAQALVPVFGAALPAAPGLQSAGAGGRLLCTTPNQYWLIATDADLAARLAAALPADVGAISALGHSRVRLAIEGPGVRGLIARGIAVDLHPDVFPVGAFALTGLHHTGVLVERGGAERYELYVWRTYAVSLWEWLIDAALPLGFDVQVEDRRRASERG